MVNTTWTYDIDYLHVTITESESGFCVPIMGRVNTISYARLRAYYCLAHTNIYIYQAKR